MSAIGQKQNIKFEHFGTDQGLSQSNVMCILQDSRGFMWFGTRDGLNKYDGYKCTVYKNDAGDSTSLCNNFIRSIMEGCNGDIWIGTSGGLCRYDRNTNRFYSYRHDPATDKSISSNVVTSIFEDSERGLWIGTEEGLNKFDRIKNKFIRFTYKPNDKNSLGGSFVRTIFEDRQHNLWIGTADGGLNLYNRRSKTFTRFQHSENDSKSIASNNIYTLFEDSKNRLWVGTNDAGLDLLNRSSGEFYHFRHDDHNQNSLAGDVVFAINEDNQHNLWIGTENKGISIFDPQKRIFYTYQNDAADNASLINNSIYAIYKDKKNSMWIGTFSGGADKVDPDAQKFAHYKHILSKNSLSDNNVLSIIEDSKKNIWIGTDGGGLNLFDPKTRKFTHFRHKPTDKNSICGDYVLSICEDSRGNIWTGTWGNGVTVFNREKHTFLHFKNNPANGSSLSNNNAWKIMEDKEKNIWIGTYGGGLNLFDPRTNSFAHFQFNEKDKTSLSGNNIQFIFEDSDGRLWVSTDGGGLNLFDKKNKTFSRFVHSDRENSICNNSAATIFEDRNKNLWIGTMDGLSCLEKKTNRFINYSTKDGLPNNVIFGILEDSEGLLWISTNKGIACFDPVRKQVKKFGISDGLQSNEFKQQAFCKSSDGSMYFGGTNGFNQFFPDSIKDNHAAPPLVLTALQIFNKEVLISDDAAISPLTKSISETKELLLSYKHSVITFEFASLHYTTTEKKQYAYMLEGFDENWNYIGTKRTATYTNLDPGIYIFKVKGLDYAGSWSEVVTSLKVTITPPFWLSWWFKTLSGLFIIGCFITIYRIRVKTITKQKAILEQQVKERTAEVVAQQKELSKHVEVLASLKESLEQEKYLLDSLMNHMPDAIYFKDKESKFVRVSKYMVNKHLGDRPGAAINDLIGKSDFDLQDEHHAREAYEDEQEIQKTGKPKIDYIEKEISKDGTERWVTTTKLPLFNPQGEVAGTFGISRDVTKIKMLEQERHDAELEKAVAQGKFEIASDFMHDIGNAVVGFGSYLTRIRRLQYEERSDNLQNLAKFFEKQRAAITIAIGEAKANALVKMLNSMAQTQKANQAEINQSITEQLNIISNIQEILNIQRQYVTGHETQERKPVNMRHIINDSLSMLFASVEKTGIEVSLNISQELPIIKGDRTKLIQVLLNVLRNSIEAIDNNSREKVITIIVHAKAGKLIVETEDSGHGFNKEISDQLFKKGYTTKTGASGLGLYSSRTIMESHEGSIYVTSAGEGKGAVATLEFKV